MFPQHPRWTLRDCNNSMGSDLDRPAIWLFPATHLSFRHLDGLFLNLEQVLASAGLSPGDVIAVVQSDGPSALLSLLAALRVGPTCPLDPSLTGAEVREDLGQLSASAIIVGDPSGPAAKAASNLGMAVIHAATTASGCEWQVVRRTASRQLPRFSPDTLLFLHTSATTSRRKLVPLTTGNVSAMIENTLRVTELTSDDRLLLLARPFHIQGTLSALAQLRAGGSVIPVPLPDPKLIHVLLQTLAPTWYTCGPTMHRALLSEIQQSGQVPPSLRFVRSAGAPLSPDLERALSATLRTPILNVYGLSETGGIASTSLSACAPVGSVGKSIGPEIAILDRSGSFAEPGEEGEIVVRGPAITHGYVASDDVNQEAFHKGWFRTGDLGLLDTEGHLFLRGRLKEIINRGGEKVLPEEVDAVLAGHPAMRDVAAFALPHPTLGEDVACAVVFPPGMFVTPEELRSFAANKLAPWKLPRNIFVRESIPRGSTGKPKRLQLREEYSQSSPPRPIANAADTPDFIEDRKQILQLWATILGIDAIRDEDDFFTLGGDSLSATSMLAEIGELFGLTNSLPTESFFAAPTLRGLLRLIAKAETPEGTSSGQNILYPMRKGGDRQTLFLIPANETRGLYLRRMVRHLPANWASYLVRPAELAPFRPLFSIEDAARHVVTAITRLQPRGPYVIGGYCQGGLVAFEAALTLERAGHPVGLLLLDTPFPGGASAVRQWRTYSSNAREKVRAAQGGAWRPILSSTQSISRKLAWRTLRKLRPLAATGWHLAPIRSLCTWATHGNFDLYRPGKGRMPILHVVASDETSRMLGAARLRWEEITSGEVTYLPVSGDHYGLFLESNFPRMCGEIEGWLEKHAGEHPASRN